METKIEPEYPSSPANDDSGDDDQDPIDPDEQEEHEGNSETGEAVSEEDDVNVSGVIEEEENQNKQPLNSNVADILKRLQSAGAIVKKPKEEYQCNTCVKGFSDWEELENHLIKHVSLPSVVLDKLPSDEEDTAPSGDENWSDEEEIPQAAKQSLPKTPQKIDISQILRKTGLSLKSKPSEKDSTSSDSALSKLSGLGFTIKKNSTPIKKESDTESQNDNVMQKLGKLGGIKLKLKSDGNNGNSFKVVNGLKDFKASDDEDEGSGNEEVKEEDESMDDEADKNEENEGSGGEQDNAEEEVEEEEEDEEEEQQQSVVRKLIVKSESDEETQNTRNTRKPANPKGKPIQRKLVTPKTEPQYTPTKKLQAPPQVTEIAQKKPPGRPAVKQTPKRGANQPVVAKELTKQVNESPIQPRSGSTPRRESTPRRDSTPRRESMSSTPQRESVTSSSTPERSESRDSNLENVLVKQEADEATSGQTQQTNMPLFSGNIKTERTSPPPQSLSTPIIARVKADPDAPQSSSQPSYNHQNTPSKHSSSFLPVTKREDTGITIIEINGDSNDEDDDCCVVSATPAPDVKPAIVPKIENPQPPPYSSTSTPFSSSQSSYSSTTPLPSRLSSSTTPSTEKQHSFNWNAPDAKPPIDMLEKSADEIFESLLSSATKKENLSLSDASEYISLDTLGPQHSCDICNTRFTDISLLEDHRRLTGHSKSLVAPSSSTLLPYSPSSNILSSLLPVKQLAEQVGKLSTLNSSGPGFTHQQNVMINIQAYPGASGVMVPPQPYNAYTPGQNMHQGYPQTSNNLYGSPGQMPGQFPTMPGQNYMGQGYGQFQPPMSKAGYPGTVPPNTYSSASSPYSSASPLQSMQQSVYGQPSAGMMSQSPGQMIPPGSSPSHQYNPASSPGGSMKSSSGIRIQNVQTFPPGQLVGAPGQVIAPGPSMGTNPDMGPGQMTAPGQMQGGQMPPPTQIRMAAGANVTGSRPRMPTVRGQRPTIRPGIQVHGQVRGGGKGGPRMPMKRPGQMMGGPGQKRRNDMLLPGKHDNEDCQVMALQKQREGLPMISSVQGAKDKLNLGGQISITKKTVNKEANAMANVLASRGISVKQKAKSRSPTPERPIPHIPNLGAGVSIKHTSKSSNFSIPEAKVGGGMLACKICKKMFMNHNSLTVHMTNAHPQSKIPVFKCDECPASYPKLLQLQHHKRVFHNVTGPNRELGLPVVDLSQEDNLKRLSNLGIYSFIPLANREHASGCFGIPVVSVHNMQNGMTAGLQALGADGLLSLGPLKPLPNS